MNSVVGMKNCWICFSKPEKNNFVPLGQSEKIFNSSFQFLHTSIASKCSRGDHWKNQIHLPFCKKCLDSTVKLTQLSDQLVQLQKQVSDLTVAFSLSVLHRQSQNKNNGRKETDKNSAARIIELDVSDLPHIFSKSSLESDRKGRVEFEVENNNTQKGKIKNVMSINRDACSNSTLSNERTEAECEDLFTNLFSFEDQNETEEVRDNTDPLQGNEIKVVPDSLNVDLHDNDHTKSFGHPNSVALEVVTITAINPDEVNNAVLNDTIDSFGLQNPPSSDNIPKLCLNKICHMEHEDIILESPNNIDTPILRRPSTTERKISPARRSVNRKKDSHLHSKNNSKRAELSKLNQNSKSKKPNRKGQFTCSICNMLFNYKTNLIRHIHQHTGAKSYKCSFCGMTFNRKDNCKQHEQLKHNRV